MPAPRKVQPMRNNDCMIAHFFATLTAAKAAGNG
jgi:hypothetical protein